MVHVLVQFLQLHGINVFISPVQLTGMLAFAGTCIGRVVEAP